jgi:ankyrin repeat protein
VRAFCRRTNQAAFVGDAAIAELLLDEGANAVAPKEDGGMTPLLFGCLRGHFAVAKVLIEKRGLDCLFLNDVQGLSPVFVCSAVPRCSFASLCICALL